jgi:predicted MPP superfamily phosphohydrolase
VEVGLKRRFSYLCRLKWNFKMNISRMIIAFIVFISLNVYLIIRGWQALPNTIWWHIIYTALFLFASLSVFLAVFLGSRLPEWLVRIFEQVGGYYMILFIFILAGAFLGDLLRIGDHFFHFFPDWVRNNYSQVRLGYFILLLLFLVILSLIGYNRFKNPGIVEFKLETNHSNGHSSEMTIVAASDIHLGNLIRKERLSKWVELINSQKPDLILLAGDIFDHDFRAVESQRMDFELLKLKATYGVYAIPGNHDYYAGIDKVLAYLKGSGITVLRDKAVIIDNRIALFGRDDQTNRNRKPLSFLKTDLPKIVIDHQPGTMNESVMSGIDLHISGHTHNGQIFPFNRIVSRIYDLPYGYKKSGNTHLYVSSGLGLWGAPIRLGTQSEILKVRFTSN